MIEKNQTNSSALYPTFSKVIFTSFSSTSFDETVKIFFGSFISTVQLFSPKVSFNAGVTFSMQEPHMMFVLNCFVFIFIDFTWRSNRRYFNFIYFNLKLLLTTLTELNAIAAPAIIGFNKNPQNGNKIPAATGIPIML